MERIKCEYLHNIDNRWFCDARAKYISNIKYCRACQKCAKCVNSCSSLCLECIDNIKFAEIPTQSHFQAYIPACPFGYMDCVYDPAYIKFYHPEYYKKEFGDCITEEVVKEDFYDCYDYFKDEKYDYCPQYDDEDK